MEDLMLQSLVLFIINLLGQDWVKRFLVRLAKEMAAKTDNDIDDKLVLEIEKALGYGDQEKENG